jgi:hypothetical protein
MSGAEDRRIAFVLGVLAAILLLLDALLHFVVGIAQLITGAVHFAAGSLGSSIVDIVVAILIGFFAYLGRSRGGDRSMTAGVVLVVLAVLGWLALGFAGSLLAIVAALLALISGVMFLVATR